jgi:tetratricopeptide (TPR) repeat protein
MEEEFQRALSLDEHWDFAGPDRSLGLLYRDAPGWPTSIGSKRKAREHLERAVKLHPEFPDNQLALLESYEKWADRQSFDRQLKTTERALAEAKKKFSGAEWEQSWTDWNKRLAEMKTKSAEVGKHTPSKGAK